MIPKIIHYCWFGKGIMPKSQADCIKSWEKILPDYEIMRWDENSSLAIKITLNIIYGKYLPAVGKEIQYTIKDKLEYFTGMYVHNVDIVVDRLIKESNNTMEEI